MWDITSGLVVSPSHTFHQIQSIWVLLWTFDLFKTCLPFFFFKCLQHYEVGSLNLSTHFLLTMRTWATEKLNGGLEVVAFPQQPTLLPLPEWNYTGPQVFLEQTRGRPCSAAWRAWVTVCSMVSSRGPQEKYWVREGLFMGCCVVWTSFHNDVTSSHWVILQLIWRAVHLIYVCCFLTLSHSDMNILFLKLSFGLPSPKLGRSINMPFVNSKVNTSSAEKQGLLSNYLLLELNPWISPMGMMTLFKNLGRNEG